MFVTSKSSVALHLHRAVGVPYHIFESFIYMLSSPSQMLYLVGVPDQLAVSGGTKRPAQTGISKR